MAEQFKKAYLYRSIKILHFLTLARIQKFKITSKYLSVFNNTPPASWVAHTTRDFLTCYSWSYYRSMIWFCRVGHSSVAICMKNIHQFFMENFHWQYLRYELWGNNKFCWVVGNIMPHKKWFKNTSEGLVIP